MKLYWRRADAGRYYLRDHDGLGEALGQIAKAKTDGASIYQAAFFHGDVSIYIRERGIPNTIIKLMEAEIVKRFPEATFQRIGF